MPGHHVNVFLVTRVSHDFKKVLKPRHAAHVLGRSRSSAVEAHCFLERPRHTLGTLDLDVVHPVVPEVIEIGEVIVHLQELVQAPLFRVEQFVIIIPVILGEAITLAIDLELVQVIVVPVEGPLDHGVQFRQRQRTRHQHATPNNWLNVAQVNPELKDAAGTKSWLANHPLRLEVGVQPRGGAKCDAHDGAKLT